MRKEIEEKVIQLITELNKKYSGPHIILAGDLNEPEWKE